MDITSVAAKRRREPRALDELLFHATSAAGPAGGSALDRGPERDQVAADAWLWSVAEKRRGARRLLPAHDGLDATPLGVGFNDEGAGELGAVRRAHGRRDARTGHPAIAAPTHPSGDKWWHDPEQMIEDDDK